MGSFPCPRLPTHPAHRPPNGVFGPLFGPFAQEGGVIEGLISGPAQKGSKKGSQIVIYLHHGRLDQKDRISGNYRQKVVSKRTPKWGHFWTLFGPFFGPVFGPILGLFWDPFWTHSGSRLESLWSGGPALSLGIDPMGHHRVLDQGSKHRSILDPYLDMIKARFWGPILGPKNRPKHEFGQMTELLCFGVPVYTTTAPMPRPPPLGEAYA